MKASGRDAFADLKSKDSTDFRQLSDRLDDESSEEEELYTDSNLPHYSIRFYYNRKCIFPLGPVASRVEEPSTVSQTESQFSFNMPYLEETTQSGNTSASSNASTEDSVFTGHSIDTQLESQITSPAPPIPRRSTRSTKGKPPEIYGQVYTFGTIINTSPECPKYRQTMYIPFYNI